MKNPITHYHNLPTFRLVAYLAVITLWLSGDWISIAAFPLYVMISFTCLNNQRYYWLWIGLLLLYDVGSLLVVTFIEPPLQSSFSISLFSIVLAFIDGAIYITCAVTALTISHREPTKPTLWLNRGIGSVYLLGTLYILVSTVMLLISPLS